MSCLLFCPGVTLTPLFCPVSQVDSDSWGNVEPDGVSQVPPTRKGLMGLLGLLGMMGAVGVVPAGTGVGVGGGGAVSL
jgi:hypothetical protein